MISFRATLFTRDESMVKVWVVVTYYSPPIPATPFEPESPEDLEWHLSTTENGKVSTALQYYAGIDLEETHNWISELAENERWGRKPRRMA